MHLCIFAQQRSSSNMALNNHINFAFFGRWTLLTSRHLCERCAAQRVEKKNNRNPKHHPTSPHTAGAPRKTLSHSQMPTHWPSKLLTILENDLLTLANHAPSLAPRHADSWCLPLHLRTILLEQFQILLSNIVVPALAGIWPAWQASNPVQKPVSVE